MKWPTYQIPAPGPQPLQLVYIQPSYLLATSNTTVNLNCVCELKRLDYSPFALQHFNMHK